MTTPGSVSPDPLQFDSVIPSDGGAVGASCAECKEPIRAHYYEVGGITVCERCKTAIETRLGMSVDAGPAKVSRALFFGSLAAAAGAILYLAVLLITNIELALLAILVGWMVGKSVRYGAKGRGGRRYQIMAVVLTYLAISISYIPQMLALQNEPRAWSTIGLLMLAVIAPIQVVILGLPASALNVLIIGVGLMQAWRINKRTDLEFKGPFKVANSAMVPNG